MSKDILTQLSELDPSRGRAPSPAEWTRSNAQIERIMLDSPRPATKSRHLPRRTAALVGAAAALVTVGAVAATTLMPNENAFASWRPIPTAATAGQALEQAEGCSTSWEQGPANPITADDVILAERRGDSQLTLMMKDAAIIECIDIGDGPTTWMMLTSPDGKLAGPAATGEDVVIDTIGATGEGSAQYTNVVGRVGPDITGVSVVVSDGTEVVASVTDGWFVAWWPGADGTDPDGMTVRITTPDETTETTVSSLYAW
jgi:hypothetical protein